MYLKQNTKTYFVYCKLILKMLVLMMKREKHVCLQFSQSLELSLLAQLLASTDFISCFSYEKLQHKDISFIFISYI